MAEQRFREMDLEDQVALHHARERRRSHADIMSGLYQTSQVAIGETPDLTALPKDSSMTITGKARIEDGLHATGSVFSLGNRTLSLDGTTGIFTFVWSTDSVSSLPVPLAFGKAGNDKHKFDFVVALFPGKGSARVWINGALIIKLEKGRSVSNWAGAGSLVRDAISLDHIEPTRFFAKQVPRFFD